VIIEETMSLPIKLDFGIISFQDYMNVPKRFSDKCFDFVILVYDESQCRELTRPYGVPSLLDRELRREEILRDGEP
jgi:hypothetical protein